MYINLDKYNTVIPHAFQACPVIYPSAPSAVLTHCAVEVTLPTSHDACVSPHLTFNVHFLKAEIIF